MTQRRKAQAREPRPMCGGIARATGLPCEKQAGWGTNHPGFGRCKWHGGSSREGIINAAAARAARLGSPRRMDPWESMLWCIELAAGELHWLNNAVDELSNDEVVGRPRSEWDETSDEGFKSRVTLMPADLHILVQARRQAMDRLATYSAMAIKAGIEERSVRLAERNGETIARLLDGIFGELKLTREQAKRAPQIVRKQLTLVAGQEAA